MDLSFLPSLSQTDIDRATQLIQNANGPATASFSNEDLRRFQQELFEIQKLQEAWGLVIPLLNHPDQNVQFFGAHTAQVKIARDWEAFPKEHESQLRDVLIHLAIYAVVSGKTKIILRKLFVSITSLAMKLVPHRPSRWDDWLIFSVSAFSAGRVPTENILDFLAIVAEETSSANLLGASQGLMLGSLKSFSTTLIQAVTNSMNNPSSERELVSALHCLQTWLPILPTNDIFPLIPSLINHLNPDNDTSFIGASDVLQELLDQSTGKPNSHNLLTDPLLIWVDSVGRRIIQSTTEAGMVDEVSHSMCKLLTSLGDHGSDYFSHHFVSNEPCGPSTKGALIQMFLQALLSYTGLAGYYGVDEEESEMVLGFWYLFQESLWSEDISGKDDSPEEQQQKLAQRAALSKVLYVELVKVLRRKVTYPPHGHGWAKDQMEKFQVYRRDVGDTLINAYYVIRDDMLAFYVNDIVQRLDTMTNDSGWEEVEATLHCIMSIQEALDYEQTPLLGQVFGTEILGRLPRTGHDLTRKTALSLIEIYSSWFSMQRQNLELNQKLMATVGFVVAALPDPQLCLQAANALRSLCDANRKALAPHIGAFAELHAGLTQIPDSEKAKVLQSISSVIQALPATESIGTIEAMLNPVVERLVGALSSGSPLNAELQVVVVLQLEILTGIGKGLTRTGAADGGLFGGLEDEPQEDLELSQVKLARQDPRTVALRQTLLQITGKCVELGSTSGGISQAAIDLFKALTALPADVTILTLPAAPLLELICYSLRQQVTASWLTLAGTLVTQLTPPPPFPMSVADQNTEKAKREEQERLELEENAKKVMANVLPTLLDTSLRLLGQPGAMQENPDIVQDFFTCMKTIAQDYILSFYELPPGALDTLLQCAMHALMVQERYSLVAASSFITNLIHQSYLREREELVDIRKQIFVHAGHGRALVKATMCGIAGGVVRSVVPNLVEVLSAFLNRLPLESRIWIKESMDDPDFFPSKADAATKDRFVKALQSGNKSTKKLKDAVNQFTLVARGLEGSVFGYAAT